MFSDLQAHGGPDKFQQPQQLKDIPFAKLEPKFVSTKKYQLKQLSQGICEYVPIVFEEQHFCVTLCTLHSALMDFQAKVPDQKTPGEALLEFSEGQPIKNEKFE